MQYAKNTEVSVAKTRAEIEDVVTRYGATSFGSMWQIDRAIISFEMKDRRLRFVLPLPNKEDRKFRVTPGGRRDRNPDQVQQAWEQACRQLWRALLLAIKAKLEAVECKISTFDEEFMNNIVMADGRTVGELILPNIPHAVTGQKQLLLS